MPIELSLYHRFNRLFYQLTASATRYWYYDYSTITALGLPAASRDRTEYEEGIRIGYELVADSLSLFISPSINQRLYVDTVNAAGQQRDSTGFNIGVGATLTLGPKSSLEGSVGWTSQTYTAAGTSTSAIAFSFAGAWNGYEPLTVRPVLTRSINKSALSNYQNYVSTVAGIDFTYDIHYPWKAVGGFSYNIADYTPVPGSRASIRGRTLSSKPRSGLLYEVRPQYSIGPLYEYSQGTSTDVAAGGPQFSRNFFSIRLVANGDVVRSLIAILFRLPGGLRCGLALPAMVVLASGLAACDPQPPMTANTLQQPSQNDPDAPDGRVPGGARRPRPGHRAVRSGAFGRIRDRFGRDDLAPHGRPGPGRRHDHGRDRGVAAHALSH